METTGNQTVNISASPFTVPLRIGVSRCLLGERVRYDGGHKFDSYINGTLGAYLEFVPLCPEVGAGLGVPRKPVRLEGDPEAPRAVGVHDRDLDITVPLRDFSRRNARALEVDGFLLKSGSPSCGMTGVKVSGAGHRRRGRGIFAQALVAAQPLLPLEEETGLGIPERRARFIEKVFAFRRWRELLASGPTRDDLGRYHRAHHLTLLSHGPRQTRELDRLLSDGGSGRALADTYGTLFMATLGRADTRARHHRVLCRLLARLRRRIQSADIQELSSLIDGFLAGKTPLILPQMLLRHHLRRLGDPLANEQTYLNPEPLELMLRCGP